MTNSSFRFILYYFPNSITFSEIRIDDRPLPLLHPTLPVSRTVTQLMKLRHTSTEIKGIRGVGFSHGP
jgi:hypothetical protein